MAGCFGRPLRGGVGWVGQSGCWGVLGVRASSSDGRIRFCYSISEKRFPNCIFYAVAFGVEVVAPF